ncbi:hypothetical protein PIIN_03923 [Serendipita indica DSM 11827]|uniref:F-box domain-containing protein n=1 Tax=Serendipita indica (strain DSM 11827) TaxID=1109443 RepID=G4TF90_SERID|nr:hypothetical protein PIIN_03923 [Serendipita indica DSM 11827]
MPRLDQLPEELYQAILESIDDDKERKSVAIALIRSIPRSPVPRRFLYYQVNLSTSENVLTFYHHLRSCGGVASKEASWVHSLHSESWTVEAQILANVLELVPNLGHLSIHVGATFAPEHVDDIFQRPRPALRTLNIVFKPYVQEATYYQFLRGAYFDSLLTHIASWPAESQLCSLSIIQTMPPQIDAPQRFAQPIVFHSLTTLSTLVHAPSLRTLQILTIRVPGRVITPLLCISAPTSFISRFTIRPRTLDLSTTSITLPALSQLLSHYHMLEHLIIDDTGLIPLSVSTPGLANGAQGEWFVELGRTCALAGMKGAREREKILKEAADTRREMIISSDGTKPAVSETHARNNLDSDSTTSSSVTTSTAVPVEKMAKKGRRGVSTAPFSIREKKIKSATTASKLNILSNPTTQQGAERAIVRLQKARILPAIPALRSLCLTLHRGATFNLHQQHLWQEEFSRGWKEGCHVVFGARKRLYTSLKNGLVYLYHAVHPDDHDDEPREQSIHEVDMPELDGLQAVTSQGLEGESDGLNESIVPILCFGAMKGSEHSEGCGHSAVN